MAVIVIPSSFNPSVRDRSSLLSERILRVFAAPRPRLNWPRLLTKSVDACCCELLVRRCVVLRLSTTAHSLRYLGTQNRAHTEYPLWATGDTAQYKHCAVVLVPRRL